VGVEEDKSMRTDWYTVVYKEGKVERLILEWIKGVLVEITAIKEKMVLPEGKNDERGK
jgi:hypothetical protein